MVRDLTRDALDEVKSERRRQDEKWGPQSHGLSVWMMVLSEEVGEVAERVLTLRATQGDRARLDVAVALQHEATQVAAVAVAMLERIIAEVESGKPFPKERWE